MFWSGQVPEPKIICPEYVRSQLNLEWSSSGVHFQTVSRLGFSVAEILAMIDANRRFPTIARAPQPPLHLAAPRPDRYRRNSRVGRDRRRVANIPRDAGLSCHTVVLLAAGPRESGSLPSAASPDSRY